MTWGSKASHYGYSKWYPTSWTPAVATSVIFVYLFYQHLQVKSGRQNMEWLTADRILQDQDLRVFKFTRERSLVLKCNVRSRVFTSV